MTNQPFVAIPPYPLLVKLRDKFAQGAVISMKTSDGLLPYATADLVATQVAHNRFEAGELKALTRILPGCKAVIDVGANLGLYTLLATRRMPPAGRVVSFEASPIEFAKLTWTVSRNKLGNVQIVLAAVSDSDGTATIYQSTSGAGALNRLDRPGKNTGEWQAVEVQKVSLDSWVARHGFASCDLIKLDVEGHEFPVLTGAEKLLSRDRPLVLIEVNQARASEQSDPERIWEFMMERGYGWYALDDAGSVQGARSPGSAINYFAVPNEPRNGALVELLLANHS